MLLLLTNWCPLSARKMPHCLCVCHGRTESEQEKYRELVTPEARECRAESERRVRTDRVKMPMNACYRAESRPLPAALTAPKCWPLPAALSAPEYW